MASIEQAPKSKFYRIRFRFNGRKVNRSLRTRERRVALSVCGRVEETLRLIKQGRLEIPANVDAADFILSDGKVTEQNSRPAISVAKLFDLYEARPGKESKEASTLKTESTHIANFRRLMSCSKQASVFSREDLQDYVARRQAEKNGNRNVSCDTVKRELTTFSAIWKWAMPKYLKDVISTSGLSMVKRDAKPPFMTWAEIESRISRGGLSDEEVTDLWATLYLTTSEITLMLAHAKEKARYPFIYPMLVFVAYTGVRRSEMLRCRVDDFDLGKSSVLVREKKRSRELGTTFRQIDLANPVVSVMKDWLAVHPGGQFAFCWTPKSGTPQQLTVSQARDHFRRTFKNSKWSKVRGFHVLRHSFASNLASRGVDQRIIDLFMGHQTEEMRQRYRHLLPNVRRDAINSLVD